MSASSQTALLRAADAFSALAEAFRALAADDDGDADERIGALWDRLGVETQQFLYELAVDFDPTRSFDLAESASRLGMGHGTARARMMTIGRSMRALGSAAPVLWQTERDVETRRRRYTWDAGAHASILRRVEG